MRPPVSRFSLTEFWIPPRLRGDRQAATRARSIVGSAFVAVVASLYFMLKYHHLGASAAVTGLQWTIAAAVASLLVLRFSGRLSPAREIVLAMIWGLMFWLCVVNRGVMSYNLFWFAIVPCAALLFGDLRHGLVWLALGILGVVLVKLEPLPPMHQIPEAAVPGLQFSSALGLILALFSVIALSERQKSKNAGELEAAQAEAERTGGQQREMLQRVRTLILEDHQALQRITGNMQEVRRAVAEQVNAHEDIAQSLNELARLVEQSAEGAGQSATQAQSAERQALEGGERMKSTRKAMDELVQAGEESTRTISALGAQGDKIGSIVQVIGEIANQTNMLALNAAIEAAHAGNLGKGFAVVADEVRKLAERTQQATAEITPRIQDMVGGTQAAIAALGASSQRLDASQRDFNQLAQTLSGIISAAQDAARLMGTMASATQVQRGASERVEDGFQRMRGASETVSRATGEVGQAIEALERQLEELKGFLEGMGGEGRA